MKKILLMLLIIFSFCSCAEKMQCDICGNSFPIDDTILTKDDYRLCDDCTYDNAEYCYSCNGYVYDKYSHTDDAYRCCCCYDIFLGDIKEIKDNAGVWHYACYECYSSSLKRTLIGCEWHY